MGAHEEYVDLREKVEELLGALDRMYGKTSVSMNVKAAWTRLRDHLDADKTPDPADASGDPNAPAEPQTPSEPEPSQETPQESAQPQEPARTPEDEAQPENPPEPQGDMP